jgi:prevent-host-death family protein
MEKSEAVVGVRDLKAHLSAYLRAVAAGGTVTIGDRSRRAIARLVPVERDPAMDHLERLAREGRVTLPTKPKPRRFRSVKPRKNGPLISDLVIEGRG